MDLNTHPHVWHRNVMQDTPGAAQHAHGGLTITSTNKLGSDEHLRDRSPASHIHEGVLHIVPIRCTAGKCGSVLASTPLKPEGYQHVMMTRASQPAPSRFSSTASRCCCCPEPVRELWDAECHHKSVTQRISEELPGTAFSSAAWISRACATKDSFISEVAQCSALLSWFLYASFQGTD